MLPFWLGPFRVLSDIML